MSVRCGLVRTVCLPSNTSNTIQMEENTLSLSCCVNKGDGGSTSMIVPVWISMTTIPGKETLVYALLEAGHCRVSGETQELLHQRRV